MTLSMECGDRLLLDILTVNGAGCCRNPWDLAELNLPADVRNRFIGQRSILETRRGG